MNSDYKIANHPRFLSTKAILKDNKCVNRLTTKKFTDRLLGHCSIWQATPDLT